MEVILDNLLLFLVDFFLEVLEVGQEVQIQEMMDWVEMRELQAFLVIPETLDLVEMREE